jgi:hypothetical protein
MKPLKMDLTEGSETSAKLNLTPGENPKENTQDSEHCETLKSRTQFMLDTVCHGNYTEGTD